MDLCIFNRQHRYTSTLDPFFSDHLPFKKRAPFFRSTRGLGLGSPRKELAAAHARAAAARCSGLANKRQAQALCLDVQLAKVIRITCGQFGASPLIGG